MWSRSTLERWNTSTCLLASHLRDATVAAATRAWNAGQRLSATSLCRYERRVSVPAAIGQASRAEFAIIVLDALVSIPVDTDSISHDSHGESGAHIRGAPKMRLQVKTREFLIELKPTRGKQH